MATAVEFSQQTLPTEKKLNPFERYLPSGWGSVCSRASSWGKKRRVEDLPETRVETRDPRSFKRWLKSSFQDQH